MAAGLGFKTFTTGEVLTAADVNGYLMQGILVFANAAARSSAITSPQEGQYSFLKDTNALEYYDGAAWVGAPVGDITAVNAGTGITGGGASGSVTITNDMATTITAAGDIVIGTGNATYDNLPIGTTGQVLTADTTVSPYKVKWASAASGGGMTLLSTTAISGTTVSVTGISGSYTELIIVIADFKAVNDNSQPTFRFNNDSGSNYVANGTIASSTDSSGNTAGTDKVWFAGQTGGGTGLDNAANDCILVMRIFRYAATDTYKAGTCYMIYPQNDGYFYSGFTNFGYKSTSAISRIDVSCSGAGFASAGNIYVYGVN